MYTDDLEMTCQDIVDIYAAAQKLRMIKIILKCIQVKHLSLMQVVLRYNTNAGDKKKYDAFESGMQDVLIPLHKLYRTRILARSIHKSYIKVVQRTIPRQRLVFEKNACTIFDHVF